MMMTKKQQQEQDAYLAKLMGHLAVPGYHSDTRPAMSCGSALGEKKDERIVPVSKMKGGRE